MHHRRTKLVCTIGPASVGRVRELIDAGMNVARINFSHGTPDEQRAAILDLMSRTAERVPSRAFTYTRIILQAVWTQDDLADGPLEYWQKLSQIIKRCTNLPTFV